MPTGSEVMKFYKNEETLPGPSAVCLAKFEVYLAQPDGYLPVLRMDTLIHYLKAVTEGDAVSSVAFETCLAKVREKNWERLVQTKTRITGNAIDSFNATAFQKPVLVNASMESGVFLSFSDFLQNRVRYPEFDVESTSPIDNLYIVQNGRKELLTNVWGYCDGKNYYVKYSRNFFPLRREGNTFELEANTVYENPMYYLNTAPFAGRAGSPQRVLSGVVANGLPNMIQDRYKYDRRLLQINMETGEVY